VKAQATVSVYVAKERRDLQEDGAGLGQGEGELRVSWALRVHGQVTGSRPEWAQATPHSLPRMYIKARIASVHIYIN
jgi:hypothetical protein